VSVECVNESYIQNEVNAGNSHLELATTDHQVGTLVPSHTFDNPRLEELSNAANGIVVAGAVRFERIE
jgi:hypothetical protein